VVIRRETLRLTAELRRTVAHITDSQTRNLVAAWVRAWDTLAPEYDTAITDLLLTVEAGRWPTRSQIYRSDRAYRALGATQRQLVKLAQQAGVDVTKAMAEAVAVAARMQPRVVASQMPRVAGTSLQLAARFDQVDERTLELIVERTATQIENALDPLAGSALESMRQALIRGVAVGDNPREAARRMVRGLEEQFNGGLTRAMTIARTEILDAHRRAAMAQHLANRDVLAGWVWTAELSRRTCPSCWAQHGSLHPLEEQGPLDHQQGRCARTPKTKSWRDLGFTTYEPPDVLPDAQAVFKELPQADRLAIMGPARLDALERGEIAWADLSQRRVTSGWRDSYRVRPVRDLVAQ
jgi:hypothetical protein